MNFCNNDTKTLRTLMLYIEFIHSQLIIKKFNQVRTLLPREEEK